MKFAKTTDTHYGFNHKTHRIHEKFLEELAQKCEEEKVDALIHSGDWIISKQDQLHRTWKMFRKYLGDLPIYTVLGNHCHWDAKGKNHGAMEADWEQWAGDHDIFLMEPHGPIVKPEKNIAIYGFNGWYDEVPPKTNDSNFMMMTHEGAPIHQFLRWKAQKKLDECIEHAESLKIKYPDIKTLLITHHPSYNFEKEWEFMSANLRWMPFISEYFDFYCVGHSHRQEDFVYKSPYGHYMRCINAGSCDEKAKQLGHRYNAPMIKIFDTEEQWDLTKAIEWRMT